MRTWSILAAVAILAISASLVMAQQQGQGKGNQNRVRGKVTKIDGADITVQPSTRPNAPADAKAPEAKTFTTNDKTTVTAGTPNGDKKTVADIKVDDTIMAVLSEDGKTATAIILNPPARQPRGGGNN